MAASGWAAKTAHTSARVIGLGVVDHGVRAGSGRAASRGTSDAAHTTTSAAARRSAPRRVMRSAAPGPAPTKEITDGPRAGRGARAREDARWPGRRSGRRRVSASGYEALARAGRSARPRRRRRAGAGWPAPSAPPRRSRPCRGPPPLRGRRGGGRGRRRRSTTTMPPAGRPSAVRASAAAAWYDVMPGSMATVTAGRAAPTSSARSGKIVHCVGSPSTATATSSPASRPASDRLA